MNAGGQRKNLVAVRAGKNSLHPHWLEGAETRNWDLVVSVYDAEARFDQVDDVRVVFERGGKWDGLHALLAGPGMIDRYEYIWLPDDDIETCAADIDDLFAAMRRYDLDVAQPALTWDSYFSHFAFMRCPGFTLRYSNCIEIMAPCLKASVLAQVVDDFRGSMSGFGLDSVWCRLSPQPHYKAAILDMIAVRHTRPVGKVLRTNMAERGQSPEAEFARLHARYNLSGRVQPLIYGAVDSTGRLREGCARLGFTMAFAYMSVFGQFRQQPVVAEKIWQLVRRQTFKKPDLTPLHRIGG